MRITCDYTRITCELYSKLYSNYARITHEFYIQIVVIQFIIVLTHFFYARIILEIILELYSNYTRKPSSPFSVINQTRPLEYNKSSLAI